MGESWRRHAVDVFDLEECAKCHKLITGDEFMVNWGICDACLNRSLDEYEASKRISQDRRYDRMCPKCRAAIGAPCTEPVRDGMKFINEVHRERLEGSDPDIAGDESD